MALQAVSEAIEKLAATDGLEARRDALALLLDTCESCYGKDAVALGNVMRSNEGRGLRVLCELLVSAKNADDEVLRQQALLVIGNLASDALDTQSSLTKGLLMQLAAHKALLHCLEASDEVTVGLACGALQNLCHDRAWSSWLLQHGAERRLEELSRSSDPTIQRYASGTLMNVSSSTHATLAGGAQAAVAQRLHDAAVESFAYARAGRTIGRAVAAIPAKARMQRIMAAQQHSSRRRTPSALLQTADSHALATAPEAVIEVAIERCRAEEAAAAAPRQRATGEQAAAAATLEKAAAERAAAEAEGAAATTPAAQQKAAAEQAAADGRTVSEEAAAIRVQAIVRGNADRQTAAAEAAAEVAAQAAAAAVAEARLLAREERRRASAAAAAAAAAAATRAAIRMQARIRGNAGRDRAAAAQRRREAEVAAAAARQRAAEEQAAAEKAATEKAAAAARAQAAAATRVQARARGNADRGVATKRRQAAEAAAAAARQRAAEEQAAAEKAATEKAAAAARAQAAAATRVQARARGNADRGVATKRRQAAEAAAAAARQRAAEEAGAAAVAAAAAAAAATKVQAIQRGCSVRAALPQRIAILVPLVKKAILVARAEAEAEALATAQEAEADALAAAKEVDADAAALALVTSLLAEEAAANQTASTDESGEIAQVTAEGAAKVHVEAWATAQEMDAALELEISERLAATAVVTAIVTAAVAAVSEAAVAAAEAAMRVADVAADAAEAEAEAAAAAAAEAEAEAEEAAKVASVAAADAEAAEAAAAKAGKEAKAVAEAAASRAREAAEAAAEAATRRATGAADATAAAARAAAEAVAAREAERAATEEVARRKAEKAADADAAALELATSLLAEEVAAKEAAAESVSPPSVSQGKPAKYNSRVQPPAWLIEAWAEQEAAETAQAAAAERAAQQRATAAANAAAAAKAVYYNSGGAMVDAAVGAPAPGATNRAAALARRREAAPPPMARATADVAPLYARRQAPPQSTSAPPSVFHDGASIYFNQNQRLLQYEPVRSKASGQAGRVARAVAGVPILAVFDQSVVAAPAPPPPVPFLPPIPTRGAVAGADGLLDGWSEAKGSPRQPAAPLSVEGLRGDAKGGNRVARARRYEALAAVGDDVASRIERKATRAIRRAADADAVGDAESVSQLEVLPHHHYYHHQQQRQRQPDHTLLPDIRLIPTIRVPIHPYHSCYRSGMKQIVGMRYHLCQDECDKLNASAEALGKQTRSSYDLCEDEYDKLNAAEKRNYEMIPPTICVDAGPIDNDELVGLASHKHRRARKSEVVRAAERAAANRLLYPGLAGGGAMGAPPHPSV